MVIVGLFCVLSVSLKLDTLSKEDAKKKMVAMQKIKSKCTGEIIIVSSTL